MGQAFDLPLELDAASLQHIEALFSRRGRPMPERNRVQAMFPRGTVVIPNPHGSAPGIDLTVSSGSHRSRFFALPGVPAEMKQMWAQTIKPRIEAMQGADRGSMYFRSVKLFGLGESDVEARVPTLIARDRYPTVGITVSQATITLRIAARAQTQAEFNQIIAPTLEEIHTELGEIIFGYDEDEVQDALIKELASKNLTLACLEVGGSWINQVMHDAVCANSAMIEAQRITAKDALPQTNIRERSTTPFLGGAVFRNEKVAENWLTTNCHTKNENQPTILQLAEQIRRQLGASIGLAVSGYPSFVEIATKPPGTNFEFWIAISGGGIIEDFVEQRNLGGHPEVLNARVAKTAMDLLRRKV
jgi:nicotinamide-nucleotide amidase